MNKSVEEMNSESKPEVPEALAAKPVEETDVSAPNKSAKRKLKPAPRKTAYTYWKQSRHGQAQGNLPVKEFRAIWNALPGHIKEPFLILAKNDLERFKHEKKALEQMQENNDSVNTPKPQRKRRKKQKTASPVQGDSLVPQSYFLDGDTLTIYMPPSIHTGKIPSESIVYGPLECTKKSPDSSFVKFGKVANSWFSVYHKRQKFQEDIWNDYLYVIPQKKVLISIQKHDELFQYPGGVWFECNPTCPICQSPAETFLVENSINDFLIKEGKFNAKKLVSKLDANKNAQYDEDHSVMRFCCFGHITFDFSFQVVPQITGQQYEYTLPILPGQYSHPTPGHTGFNPYATYFQ